MRTFYNQEKVEARRNLGDHSPNLGAIGRRYHVSSGT